MDRSTRPSHLIFFLGTRLRFLEYFYSLGTAPFLEIMRKVEAHESPYDETHLHEADPEDGFQNEWENADSAVAFIGMTCLTLLQQLLNAFLDAYIVELGGDELKKHLGRQKTNGGWLAKYRLLCSELNLGLEWEKSGADLNLIEQMVLTRNDYQHGQQLWRDSVYQSEQHARKYPDSFFKDMNWPPIPLSGPRLVATKEHLDRVCQEVVTLCSFLETARAGRRFRVNSTSP